MTANTENRPTLYGRQVECEMLAGLVGGARRGHGAVLVVRGEPGTGKTALLDYAAGLAAGMRVVRAAGTESETELAYAGLHQLCGSMTDLLGRLPGPQRDALNVVFGVRAESAPDRFLVGLGVLGLLTEAAAEGPLICVIDDAQWLDQASERTLAFAARRLPGSVLAIFAVRQPEPDLAGLPELVLTGLRDSDARDLLAATMRSPLDKPVREQIVAETRGNPRALLELLQSLSPARLAGGFGFPDMPSRGIPAGLLRQIGDLPAQTRLLLLVAAADPTGDPVVQRQAAGYLSIPAEAAYPLAEAGLLTFGVRVVFQGVEVRAAAYGSAPPRDRRAVHHALAQATAPREDQDRRAWHQAQAALGPDEDVAAELERTAAQAQERGGLAASAAFLERAALLTPDTTRRASRTLAAAAALQQAGALDAAAKLLEMPTAGIPGDHQRAHADWMRARLTFAADRSGDTARPLLDTARRLDRFDADQAHVAYRDAISAAMSAAGTAAPGGAVTDVARAIPRARPDSPGPHGLLLDGLAAFFGEGYAAGAPILRAAITAFGRDTSATGELHWLPLACTGALYLWDDEAWYALAARRVQQGSGAGALGDLPLALTSLACAHLVAGELDTAAALTAEARTIAEATGVTLVPYSALGLAALRGHQAPALAPIDSAGRDAALRGAGLGVAAAKWATALLYNGTRRYGAALSAAEEAIGYAGSPTMAGWAMAELIEAAARTGQPQRAAGAMRYLGETAVAAGTAWALGVRARSLALMSDGEAAEELYQEAIRQLGQSRARVGLARAHLVYGEWLRRQNRRFDAREQLRHAHDMLTAMGVGGFAERARRELLATGETARKRGVDSGGDLTAQELQIAEHARDGRTNNEIGAELFLSPRTVEWHLRNVFIKLGITSRRQLRDALPAAAAMVSP